ncbi:hypothetical protein RhiirA5_421334 [Rhizophagus irregularis]|uniref:Uncharacterized protein n=2 Tax=Rhizophagus irregularis TaxID=588596 RepID=A0A2N0PE66_9GLOM|nr:hypothetical protein RirG_270110 [Rhizophagus irregularis DAOM 197198w]PKC05107.1 hypothetical protein RhiirA5_421334 [Rhizophagus irregularis]GET53694.1 hypothetical protein GLOIN_2v1785823 [Rhizophagus irregularis DAOM 181602=DAOM 197198]
MVYFNSPSSSNITPPSLDDIDDIPIVLPCSTCNLYTDGSFLDSISGKSPFMSSAWLALDDDNLILESSSDVIPSTYPSALRSETFTLQSALKTLSPLLLTLIVLP